MLWIWLITCFASIALSLRVLRSMLSFRTLERDSSTIWEATGSTRYPEVSPRRHAPSIPSNPAIAITIPFIPLIPPSFIGLTPLSVSSARSSCEVAAPKTRCSVVNPPVM